MDLNSTNWTQPVCVPVPNYYTIAFQAIVIPSLLFNSILFVAALLDRVKLARQNYLFASVISTLLSNMIYLLMLEWTLIDNYFEIPINESVAGEVSFAKNIWVLEEAVTIVMPFLICGNIVCLTFVTVSSAAYVGRIANVEDTDNAESRFQKVRIVTLVLIVTSWTVPVILTIIGVTSMNCVKECICPSTNFDGDLCPGQENCSNFWAPVTKAYLWINVSLWFLAVIGLCALVGYAIKKYQKTMTQSSVKSDKDPNEDVSTNNNEIEMPQYDKQKPPLKRQQTKRNVMQRLNSRLRFALILTVIYVVCSSLFIISVIIDTTTPDASQTLIFALCRITIYLYTTSCPVVMVKHLPVLKTSLIKLFHRMRHPCKMASPGS